MTSRAISSTSRRAPALAAACALLLPLFAPSCERGDAAVPAPAGDPLPLAAWPLPERAARGAELYARHCIGCHGAEGAGDGAAAAWLDPRPRNFQAGQFKFRSTPYGDLPTEDDLVRTLRCGLAGSSMPSFRLLPEDDLRALAAWVRELALWGGARRDALDDGEELAPGERREMVLARIASRDAYHAPAASSSDPGSVGRGRVLYEERCAACHGTDGRGAGPAAPALRDWKDAPVPPRDFTRGVFRAGGAPQEIFLRLKSGVGGTPMPAYSRDPDAELWDLVHYVRSLVDPAAPRARHEHCAEGDR